MAHVEEYCFHARREIELANEPEIVRLRAEIAICADEEHGILERLRLAPPPGDLRSRRRKAWLARGIAFLLILMGFAFSVFAFDPFRFGWKGYLYSLGIAVLSPACVEKFLEEWGSPKLTKALVTLACVAAITSMVFLAMIRGDLLGHQLKDMSAPVLVTDGAPAASPNQDNFYDQNLFLLRLAMVLLAVAMELGAGLKLHEASRLTADSGDDPDKLSERLIQVRSRMADMMFEICRRLNEGPAFEARFWRDFYRAMLTQTIRKGVSKLLGLFVCLLLLGGGRTAAQGRLNLVVAVDLTASEAVIGHDGQMQFNKNLEGVGRLLAAVPAGSKVTIIGIAGNSFGQPFILLSADISNDEGYFGERLAAARQQLVHSWQERSRQLKPGARNIDVLGALLVASTLFEEAPLAQEKCSCSIPTCAM